MSPILARKREVKLDYDMWALVFKFLEKSDIYHTVVAFPNLNFLGNRIFPTQKIDLPQFRIEWSFTSCNLITGLDDTCCLVNKVFTVLQKTSHIKDIQIVQSEQGLVVLNYEGDLVVIDLKNGDKATKRRVQEIIDYDSWKGLKVKLFNPESEDDLEFTLQKPFSLRGRSSRYHGRTNYDSDSNQSQLSTLMANLWFDDYASFFPASDLASIFAPGSNALQFNGALPQLTNN